MALTDFFRINMPYGMMKNSKGEWFFFNREYSPLGWNEKMKKSIHDESALIEYPVFTKYKKMTPAFLEKIAWHKEKGIKRNQEGEIEMVFFYNDGNNPQSMPQYWDIYFSKIKELSKCEIKKTSVPWG